MDALRFVNGKLLPLGLPSIILTLCKQDVVTWISSAQWFYLHGETDVFTFVGFLSHIYHLSLMAESATADHIKAFPGDRRRYPFEFTGFVLSFVLIV